METSDFSLYGKLRVRILEEVVEETRRRCTNFVVVVDGKTLGIISSAVRIFDITDRGAVVVELLEKARKPLPMIDALYFVTAKAESVDRIIKDFTEENMYKSAHIYFTGRVSDEQMTKIAQSRLFSYIHTFQEANCGFRLIGSDQFSLELPGILSSLYLCKSSADRRPLVHHIAQSLASVCGVLNDFPYICYQSDSLISQELSLALEDHLSALYRKVPELKINDSRPIFIVLDRSFDLSSALIHDVHYEALLKDLFEVGPDGHVTYASYENSNAVIQKEAVINEFDLQWKKLRYIEIDEAQGVLNQELKNFRIKNSSIEQAGNEEGVQDLKTMAKVVSCLSEYNETVSQFAVHRYLIETCLKSFSDEGITELSELEQMVLTGFDTEKETYKEEVLLGKVLDLMKRVKNDKEKLRLALLILNCIQLSEADRQNLIDMVPPALTMTLTKLSALGVDLQAVNKSRKRISKDEISELKKKLPPITKIFNYAELKISEIVRAAVENRLEKSGFKYCRQAPPDIGDLDPVVQVKSLRKKQNPTSKSKRRVILFVVGGVSYSEIRVSADFPENQVIIGGTRVFSPLEFVQELIEMNAKSSVLDLEPAEILLDFS